MKRALVWTIIVVSNVLVLWLFARLLDNGNLWTSLMYVIGPLVFSLPWYVIQGKQK